MNTMSRTKKGVIGVAVALAVSVLVVACGGGSDDQDAAVQEAERAQALGLFDKLPVSWVPETVDLSVGTGVRQDVPITLTTKVALKNARVVFVPDLRNVVTVTPNTIPELAAGQSATVTLTFASSPDDTRKLIAGIVLLFDRNATTSRPLPVKVRLVKPADWPEVPQGQGVGVTLKSPPNWMSSYIASEELVTVRNFEKQRPLSDEKFRTEAYFQVFRQTGVNPERLPIEAWISGFLEPGLPTPIKQKLLTVVGGRPAVRLVVSEMGGDRAHIYLASETDVVEVAYGLYEPSFISAYESILASLKVAGQ
jgi:hypothetical protein